MIGLRELNLFVVIDYLEAWFTATDPVVAPRTDLQLLKNLCSYTEVSEVVASLAQAAFRNHLWYLSELCIALAFFDSKVRHEEKRKMVKQPGL